LNDHTSTLVDSPRYCDFCDTTKTEAKYDGATSMGPWAYMCEQHYSQYGEGLGLGLGQRLIVKTICKDCNHEKPTPDPFGILDVNPDGTVDCPTCVEP